MMWPWQAEETADRALPRWHHWLIAAILLIGMMIVTPLFAAFL